jgi:aspartate/methionine/tyrosine aminotransferase
MIVDHSPKLTPKETQRMKTLAKRSFISQRVVMLKLSGVRRIFEAAQKLPDAVHLEIGQPNFETPRYICAAVKADIDSGKYTSYTPSAGYLDLRQAIAATVKRECGCQVSAETQVMVSAGSAGSLFTGMMAVVDPGDEVLLPDPGYPQYTQMVLMAGGKPVYYRLREETGFVPDIAEMSSLVTARTKVLLLNTPHNPTGTVFDKATMEGLANLAIEHDLLVISDEVYSKLVYDGAQHLSIAALAGMSGRTITIDGVSKTYAMTGWRLGYAWAAECIIREMTKLQSLTYTCPSSISQRAALAALSSTTTIVDMVASYRQRRDWFIAELNRLPGIRCSLPRGAFYAFPNISSYGMSADEFAARLLDVSRVVCVPGTAFGAAGEGHIRMSYAAPMEQLVAAIEHMHKALPRLR